MFQRFLSRPIYPAFVVAAIAFVMYLRTLAPSVDFIDAGELATVCTTFGIAHPTGYPLFTLVGGIFAHLPMGSTVIYRLNIMAAFFTALGAGGVVLLANELFSFWMPERRKRAEGQKNKGKSKQGKGKRDVVARSPRPVKEAPAQVPEEGRGTRPLQLAAAVATGMAVAFSATWWAQSCSIEVYPLHLFLMPLVLVFFLRMLRLEEVGKIGRDGKLFALILGLSFTNHMTTVLLAPACLYMFFARYGIKYLKWKLILKSAAVAMIVTAVVLLLGIAFVPHNSGIEDVKQMGIIHAILGVVELGFLIGLIIGSLGSKTVSTRRILRLTPFFLAGLALYIYLPIRSAMYPPMDWGHPTTIGAFLRHVSAKQFQIWMYTGTGAAAKQWAYFWSRVPKEFTILGALLALLGIWKMYMSASIRRTHILIFTMLLFFGCLLYSINYDIHDIDSYFLLAYLAMALWIGAGVQVVGNWIASSMNSKASASSAGNHPPAPSYSGPEGALLHRRGSFVVAGIAVLLGIIEIGASYSENDESGNYMVEDYTLNVLHNLPPNAIIFSTQWDFFVSGAFYYQLVEHVRPDVLVIDKAMLRDRPWYYAELEKRAPEVFARVKPEEQAFLQYLNAFVADKPFDQAAIAPAYQQFTSALVECNMDRPIFVTQEMVEQPDELFAPKMKAVPAGIAYRLVPRDTMFDAQPPKLIWNDKGYRQRDYYTDELRTLQAMPLASYGQLEMQHGNKILARQFFDAALTFTPDLSANLDNLSERDRGIAESTNEQFGRIRNMRASLGK